jgi:hypothetical protein
MATKIRKAAPKVARTTRKPTPSAPTTPPLMVTLRDIVAMAHPLSRDRIKDLKRTDPRFPKPVFGGGHGSTLVFARTKVVEYLQALVAKGPPR